MVFGRKPLEEVDLLFDMVLELRRTCRLDSF